MRVVTQPTAQDLSCASHVMNVLLQKVVPFLEGCSLEYSKTNTGADKKTGQKFSKVCAIYAMSNQKPVLAEYLLCGHIKAVYTAGYQYASFCRATCDLS